MKTVCKLEVCRLCEEFRKSITMEWNTMSREQRDREGVVIGRILDIHGDTDGWLIMAKIIAKSEVGRPDGV